MEASRPVVSHQGSLSTVPEVMEHGSFINAGQKQEIPRIRRWSHLGKADTSTVVQCLAGIF